MGATTQGLLCGMISQRDAQGQNEVVVKHYTCSAGETDRSERKWRSGDPGTNRMAQEEVRVRGQPKELPSRSTPGYIPEQSLRAI